jgi:hypothetical protein
MDQTLYHPFVEGLPLRTETLRPGERDGDILLPVVVTHPDVTDPAVVGAITPHLWPLDTSFDGMAVIDPLHLLEQFHLVALPSNGAVTTPASNRLPFYGSTSFHTEGVSARRTGEETGRRNGDNPPPVHLFGASLWLVHDGQVQLLKRTNRFAVQENRERTLLGHRAVLKSGLILEVDYDPFSPTLTVWKMRDVL